MKKRIVIVDDHASVRQMLGLLLSREPDYEVVGEAGTGIAALRTIGKTEPEMVILDLLIPELGGVEVLRRIQSRHPQTRVLIYSGTVDRHLIVETLKSRPAGYVEKGRTLQTLLEALRAVAGGGSYFTPFASRLLYDTLAMPGEVHTLSGREREVLQMIAESRTSKEIAGRLGLALKTVENHRAHLMDKLHLHDIAALTRYAVQQGFIVIE